MAGLTILKYTHNLSDEVLCERWVENPYHQLFCGEEFFRHKLMLDRTSLTRWRQRMGEEKIVALIQESFSVAVKGEAISHPSFPRSSSTRPWSPGRSLSHRRQADAPRARDAGAAGQETRHPASPSYARVGKFALIKHQRYAHAKQFKRANRRSRRFGPIWAA